MLNWRMRCQEEGGTTERRLELRDYNLWRHPQPPYPLCVKIKNRLLSHLLLPQLLISVSDDPWDECYQAIATTQNVTQMSSCDAGKGKDSTSWCRDRTTGHVTSSNITILANARTSVEILRSTVKAYGFSSNSTLRVYKWYCYVLVFHLPLKHTRVVIKK